MSMQSRYFLAGIVTVTLSGHAMAACPDKNNTLTAAEIQTLLATSGRYACGVQYDGQRFNEYLIGGASGDVWDYKKGSGPSIDPSKKIGTYVITPGSGSNPDTITYTYGSKSYTYVISPKKVTVPDNYDFCQVSSTASPNNVGSTISGVKVSNSSTCP